MYFIFSKKFLKHSKRLTPQVRKQLGLKLKRFKENSKDPLLKDHALKGSMLGQRAFAITGDVRLIYRYVRPDVVKLLNVGKHNSVYTDY